MRVTVPDSVRLASALVATVRSDRIFGSQPVDKVGTRYGVFGPRGQELYNDSLRLSLAELCDVTEVPVPPLCKLYYLLVRRLVKATQGLDAPRVGAAIRA